ncbi:MAG: adenylyltransferase/cytidyltransferase family protein [bacterium]|nr:adenylyltransferase/cytidyltransferase family protein [bacterium]
MEIGFFPGSFDLCHAGHVLSFKEARENCGKLIVGLQVDPSVDRPDKNKPIMSVEERQIILQGVRYIDEIKEYRTEADLVLLVRELKPDVYYIGEDWRGRDFSAKAVCEELGIRVHYLDRNHSYSSSGLRQKVYMSEYKKRAP